MCCGVCQAQLDCSRASTLLKETLNNRTRCSPHWAPFKQRDFKFVASPLIYGVCGDHDSLIKKEWDSCAPLWTDGIHFNRRSWAPNQPRIRHWKARGERNSELPCGWWRSIWRQLLGIHVLNKYLYHTSKYCYHNHQVFPDKWDNSSPWVVLSKQTHFD